jgi:hypothetical protein
VKVKESTGAVRVISKDRDSGQSSWNFPSSRWMELYFVFTQNHPLPTSKCQQGILYSSLMVKTDIHEGRGNLPRIAKTWEKSDFSWAWKTHKLWAWTSKNKTSKNSEETIPFPGHL